MPVPNAAVIASDFPDWLSPILVKEFRQGLKARLFFGIFILLQVAMVILLGLELVNVDFQSKMDTEGFDVCFWIITGVALLALAPVRGLTTLSEEQKINTLDLVQLSHLGPLRTIVGKWMALAVQSVLLATTILPYVVLRYFIGQLNVFDEITTLFILLVVSLLLTALTITLSTSTLFVRCLVLVGIIPMFILLARMITVGASRYRFFAASDPITLLFGSKTQIALSAFLFTVYGFYLLEIAAARIASASENHSWIKRGICHAILLFTLALTLLGPPKWAEFYHYCFIPLIVWSMMEALSEAPNDLPCIYQPFYRRGLFGRLLARLYLPGWASGILYSVVTVALLQLCELMVATNRLDDLVEPVFDASLITLGIVNPVILLWVFNPKHNRMWYYVLAVLLHAVIFLIASVSDNFTGTSSTLPAWMAAFPTSILLAAVFETVSPWTKITILILFFICAAIYACVLTYFTVREFRRVRRLALSNGPSADAALPATHPLPEPTLQVPDLE